MTTLVMIAHPRLRHRRVPAAAGERSAERRLPDDHGQRHAAGHEPADDGGDGRDAAREAVLDDRRHRQHDVDVEPRADADRRAVRARPQHRRRRAGRAGRDRADARASCRRASSRRRTRRPTPPTRRSSRSRSRRPRCRSRRSTSIGETTIAQRLSMVGGVAQVLVYGAQKYAVRLQLDPRPARDARHRARGRRHGGHAAERQHADGRALGARRRRSRCRPPASSTTRSQFGDIIVAYRNGAPVHLSELGRVTDDVQNNKTASWYNGEPVDRARDSAAARHEHGRGGQPREGGARQAPARRSRRR